jgi:hypothetical protein
MKMKVLASRTIVAIGLTAECVNSGQKGTTKLKSANLARRTRLKKEYPKRVNKCTASL